MESPAAALQLLRSEDGAHFLADVEEPDPVGGQLEQSLELLLQVAHRLLETEADGLHPLAPANVHRGAAGAQVYLRQWSQLAILGYEDVVPKEERRASSQPSCFWVFEGMTGASQESALENV